MDGPLGQKKFYQIRLYVMTSVVEFSKNFILIPDFCGSETL